MAKQERRLESVKNLITRKYREVERMNIDNNQFIPFHLRNCAAWMCALSLILLTVLACNTRESRITGPEKKAMEKEFVYDDDEIYSAIENALWDDQAVIDQDITVMVNDGVVTLKGVVENLRQTPRVLKIVRNIKGVRSVIDRMVVDPVNVPDEVLQQDIAEALMFDPATNPFEIQSQVKEGVVTLSGTVHSGAEESLAEFVVSGIRGVKEIRNMIQIKPVRNRPSGEMKEDIVQRLATDALVDSNRIQVEVKGKSVILKGDVGSAAERAQAYRDAWTAGVTNVNDDQLKVSFWDRDRFRRDDRYETRPDKLLKSTIFDAFRYDPRVRSSKLEVRVSDGIVTLAGSVDSIAARDAAEEDASDTVGVWRVRNFLSVKPKSFVSDDELAERVGHAFRRDAFLYPSDLHAEIQHGTVYLLGKVESQFEKQHASKMISRINGVTTCENLLHVQHSMTPKLDWELSDDITKRLRSNPYVRSKNIQIEVEDRVVEFKGIVSDWRAYREVLDTAYRAGAEAVRDQLLVKEGPEGVKASV